MFWHLYKYRVKVLLKNKYLLFWLGLFPIILGTFFNMAFSDISEMTEHIDAINVVVTADEKSENEPEKIVERDEAFATFLETMEDREYFNITYARLTKYSSYQSKNINTVHIFRLLSIFSALC